MVDTLAPVATSGDQVADSARRARWRGVRLFGVAVLLVVLVVEVWLLAPSLADGARRLGNAEWGWVAAAVLAQAVSILGFALMQRRLLRSAEVPVRPTASLSVALAANALSTTLPGGPVFGATFTFRQFRRWGASRIVASWQLAMGGVLTTGGLALVGAAGALAVGGTANPASLTAAVLATVALVVGVRLAAQHPDRLRRAARALLVAVNNVRRRPAEQGLDRVSETFAQLESVHLSGRDGAVAFGWAAVNRLADVACLGFACAAAGAQPSIAGLLIAYATGKAIATVPLTPGGIGVVDGAFTAALVAGGLAASVAFPAVVIYRLISFVALAGIGWLVFAARFRVHNHDHPDDVVHPSRASTTTEHPQEP